MSMKHVMTALILALMAFSAASCGVKNDPKAPGKSQYPRSYPATQ